MSCGVGTNTDGRCGVSGPADEQACLTFRGGHEMKDEMGLSKRNVRKMKMRKRLKFVAYPSRPGSPRSFN